MVNMFEDEEPSKNSLVDEAVDQLMAEARVRQGGRDMLSIPNYRDPRSDDEDDREFY